MPDQPTATSDQFQQILAGQLVNARVERDEYRERMNDLVDQRDGLDFELTAAQADRDEARKQLDTMRGIARGNRRHVATLTGILDTIEQLAKRWTDRPGTPEHDCAIDILKAINSGIAPVPGSSPCAPEADDRDPELADALLTATSLPRSELLPEVRRLRNAQGWDPSSPQWAVIRAAIDWRNTIAAGTPYAAALIEAVDALPRAGEPGESQASEPDPADVAPVLAEIAAERNRQDAKWGEQNHPDGTGDGGDLDRERANYARRRCQLRAAEGVLRWRDVIEEEIAEAFAETDPQALRGELVQVAAVAVAWVEAIDRRNAAYQMAAGRG